MTAIAILGSGRVAASLAAALARAGHRLTMGTRDQVEAQSRWQGPTVTFAAPGAAAEASDIVFNATPGDTSIERLTGIADALAGKILVDVANASRRNEAGVPEGLLYPSDSLAERLQAALPATRLVKTLNTVLSPVMDNPGILAAAPTAFLSGNEADAKAQVRLLLADMGWLDEWVVDLGGIETARGPEAVILMMPGIIRAFGLKPFAISVAR